MTPLMSGLIVLMVLLVLLATGMPIAFALGLVAVGALVLTDGWGVIDIVGETFFAGLAEFGLVSIPMFILMGAAVASSPAGKDLYEALDRWLNRVPGGLILSNIGACSVFAALSGSSPATCAAIGKMGIPEMQQRGYPDTIAAGSIAAGGTLGILIPPSVTMIVYGIATETSIGRLFIAGLLPGLMLTVLFMIWAIIDCRRQGYSFEQAAQRFTLRQKLEALPRVLPFLAIIVAILYVLYGGVATPSEAAGAGALFCILLVVVIYQLIPKRRIDFASLGKVFGDSIRESIMIMLIIAASELFSFALSSMFVTQSVAEWIAALEVNRWVLMGIVNLFLLVAGFFLPPVAVILMTAPILIPIILQAGFDPYWFAVVLTINMEIGLITPPVGLNLYVINGIAPDISLKSILVGSLPFVLCMVLGILLLCVFPGIATWLPEYMMGAAI
jgi:tripartite ATP-independent transporter DctM subunit